MSHVTPVATQGASASRARRRRRKPSGVRALRLALNVCLMLVAVLMVAPLVWLFSTSLTEPGTAFQLPPNWLPIPFTLANFADVFTVIPIGRMALNSVIVAGVSVIGSLFIASLAAYAFSRIDFRGRTPLFVGMLSALMIPGQLTIIPIFILMRMLGLIDTLAALWLPALINVFAIFFLRQYFNSIPRDLDEAARIDGAGHLRILFQIILPLSGPALSALAILGFEASWNNYFGPLIFLNTPENMTLPVGLVALSAGLGASQPTVVFAGITFVVLPMLVLFLLTQRAFVESVATVGVRG
ncbi:carbohydrate ABC transporter permease [Microbacterium hydrocarbonoxydans]|uniref:carbohydrate ABC transporter permease n=1 Tax=Microbacterium hydrocarbonoxydans TaxID=273678 RepID=UPI003D981403